MAPIAVLIVLDPMINKMYSFHQNVMSYFKIVLDLLNVSINFHSKQGAFLGAGGELTRTPRICRLSPVRYSKQESPIFRFEHFLVKSTSKDNKDAKKETKVKHKLVVNALPLFYYNFLYQASRHEYENKR